MKVYKVELLIVDHDKVGKKDIKIVLENTKFPNWCIYPKVMNIEEKDIGEWEDNNPLNITKTCKEEYNRLFNICGNQ